MYKLPETLGSDITRFAALANDFQQEKIEPVQFKAFRVPMGIYEQRQDNVYMSRVRTTGGVIYPKQFLKLIEIAQKHKSNLLHITTRQEIQLQNLNLNEIEAILLELQETGLSTKGGGGNTIRNILVPEESGICSSETFDTTPYAMQLTSKVIAEADSFLLPRKMKIAFSSGEKQPGYAAINDVGLVAKIKDGEKGFLVYAGGGGGAKPTVGWLLFDFIPASDLFVIIGAIKKFFSDHGNRKNRHKARLRFIFYKLGEEETLRLIKGYYQDAKKTEPPFTLNYTEDERPPYSYLPDQALTPDNTDEYNLWKKRYVTPQKQNGYNSILVPVLSGNISLNDEATVSGISKLLQFIARFGKHTIRFTTTQNIRLRNIPDIALPELYSILKEWNSQIDHPVLTNNIVSCTGADTCRLGIGLSKGLAGAIRRELLKSGIDMDPLSSVNIHISGCPNSCGQQLWTDLGFAGKILRNDRIYPGYQVYLAANRNTAPKLGEPAGSINARDIPEFTRRLLEAYYAVLPGYKSFASYLEGEGKSFAVKLIEEYKEIPSFADDKNYYFDWGAESIFSVIGQGAAECSAGLFDMIEVDLNHINNNRSALSLETDRAKRNHLLYDIIYSSSRMLLVTRGAEPKTTAEVFNLFIKNFIEYGFVEDRYRSLIVTARDHKDYDFSRNEDEIYALADRVTDLYRNMDDSLQFKDGPPAKEDTSKSSRKQKDLRGVSCPMNFVQTKIQLSTIQSGEELEIWLDDGPPINNVPASVRAEGHDIIEQTRNGEYWKVIIRKK
ncbi:MAG: sulfurtransferase TusA family protein [Tannerella sp.]|jgi:sulfite reductase (ferredoxin)|nr:sulfurtransferase TusA family protein [Tannerella sp.]